VIIMSSDMKTVVLTKQAAADMAGGSYAPKRRGRTAKKSHDVPTDTAQQLPVSGDTKVIKLGHIGGNTPLPPPPTGMSTAVAPPTVPLPQKPLPQQTPSLPVAQPSPAPSVTAIPSTTTGGTVKVELKKKSATKKVQLQPKKAEPQKTLHHAKRTIKRPRKIILGVSSMYRRLTRAKKTHSHVSSMPLDKLKEALITKKLIKPTSKAPEAILRQIAADAQIVADKAL
jgi:hypothetical protein